jgi:GxxExxY protein
MTENEISYKVRGAAFKVYNELGPGLLESAYKAALDYQFKKDGLNFHREIELPIIYDNTELDKTYKLDFLVEDKVIVEAKSVEEMKSLHHLQILSHLRLSKRKLGLLINFNTDDLAKSIYRKVNNLYEETESQ